MNTFFRIYSVLLGMILAANVSLAFFAHGQTGENYVGIGFAACVLSVFSLLVLEGLRDDDPIELNAGTAACVGNLIIMGYLLSIVL